jgi:uncharacterized repeat protein (TIGR01451 family)
MPYTQIKKTKNTLIMKKLLLAVITIWVVTNCESQNIIWSNDFSNCNDWVLGNANAEGFNDYAPDVNFICGTQELALNREFPIESTSHDNGYMYVNSPHTTYSSSDLVVENCWFQTSQPINIAGLDDIYLRFETAHNSAFPNYYQSPNHAPKCLLEISTDGITWPDISTTSISQAPAGTRFLLWPENLSTQEIISNPKEEVFHLSQIASQDGVNQIWLRFRWVGVFDLNWMIDDVQIVTTPSLDLGIANAWIRDIWSNYEYSVVPVGIGSESNPVAMFAAVRNYSQTNQLAEVVVELDGQEFFGSRMIPAGKVDTVYIEVIYPQTPGNFDVSFSLPDDDNASNNNYVKPLEISDTRTRQSFNSNLKELIAASGVDLSASVIYYFESNDSESQLNCVGLNVFFGPTTQVGSEVKIELIDATFWETFENIVLASSDPFVITSEIYGQILNGQPIFIPFLQPINLFPFAGYNARVKKVNLEESISFLGELNDSDNGGYITTADGSILVEFLRPVNFTPAIELSFTMTACNDPEACNFGALALCTYPVINYLDCDGNCINDVNQDGICEPLIVGCTDPNACNFNPDAQLSSFCSYPPNAFSDCDGCFNDANNNGVCDELEVLGCNNIYACNYNPSATINDGSCILPESNDVDCEGNCILDYNNDGICENFEVYGCTDPAACNFNPNATFSTFCISQNSVYIHAYNDANNNADWDNGEFSIGSVGSLTFNPGNITAFVNEYGQAFLPFLEPGEYELTFNPAEDYFTSSFPNNSIPITISSCENIQVPISVIDQCLYAFHSSASFQYSTIECNEGANHYAFLMNQGSEPISGNLSIFLDPSLLIDNLNESIFYSGSQPYTSQLSNPSTNQILWEFTDFPPGASLFIYYSIVGPGPEFVGTTYEAFMDLEISCQGNLLAQDSWASTQIVSCAYDPNDIQGDPVGYTDNHFILEDTEIEYRIRFQNTGNAPAQNVRIENLIDIEKLDISTFQPTSASDPMTVNVDDNGMVNFMFNGIMLPDSGSNFLESIGSLTYKIRTKPGVSPGDIIENTAGIYFDSNPPIITNTAFHEIYTCDEIPRYNEIIEICFNEDFSHEITYPYLESTEWFVNGNFIADVTNFDLPIVFGNDLEIEVVMTNPLCEVTSQWTIEELEIPSDEAFYNEQNQTFSALDGVAWQWYNADGTIIPGATEQTFGGNNSDGYYVIITGQSGCAVQSNVVNLTGIDENTNLRILAYPNPVVDNLQLQVSQAFIGSEYSVHDVTGRVVMRGKINAINSEIDFSQQSSGSYIIKVGNANVRVQK